MTASTERMPPPENHDVLDALDTVPAEAEQLRLSGFEWDDALQGEIDRARRQGDAAALRALLPRLGSQARRRPDWPYREPDDLVEILAAMPGGRDAPAPIAHGADLADRIAGAWLARCAGCCVGKPVEGLTRSQVRAYLRAADAWPLTGYIPSVEDLPAGIDRLNPSWVEATRGRVDGMPRDDDTDYTILALHVLERYGQGFDHADVAKEWLDKLPFLQTFTAERATYRNIVAGVPVDRAGRVDNPYREWIGALIRVDVYGYVSPGDPARAARLAFQDARLSHTGNGVYGAMWAAALIAGAFSARDAVEAVERSRRFVPDGTRLAVTLDAVLDRHRAGGTWHEAIEDIDERFAEHSWVHTLNNAAIIAAGLLWSGDDPEVAIGLTVQAGYDTDSAAATVGSVMGALLGETALPAALIAPLGDRIRSAVRGYDGSSIRDLARRTHDLVGVPAGANAE